MRGIRRRGREEVEETHTLEAISVKGKEERKWKGNITVRQYHMQAHYWHPHRGKRPWCCPLEHEGQQGRECAIPATNDSHPASSDGVTGHQGICIWIHGLTWLHDRYRCGNTVLRNVRWWHVVYNSGQQPVSGVHAHYIIACVHLYQQAYPCI